MEMLYKEVLYEYVTYQYNILNSFFRQYTNLQDSKFLLDYPKNGYIEVNKLKWHFVKHGLGIRFTRCDEKPFLVVDIHDFFGCFSVLDEWRLSQYLQSYGFDFTKEYIDSFLIKMSLDRVLVDFKKNKYKLVCLNKTHIMRG